MCYENDIVVVKDICEAWDSGMKKKKEEGMKEGIKEGIQQANRRTALNMYCRNYSAEDAAALLLESVETVKYWYSEFASK